MVNLKIQSILTAVSTLGTEKVSGYFFSAESGYRSKNRLDFQIDHIQPMSQGGKTTLDNLQLLTRKENGTKGDKLV